MENEHFVIARQIKPITRPQAIGDLLRLECLEPHEIIALSPRCNIGNKYVDYHTFHVRLKTAGKQRINFYEFLQNWTVYKDIPHVVSLLRYYAEKRPNANETLVKYNVFKMYWGRITSFRPIQAIHFLATLPKRPTRILDPCMGWGGRMVGAAVFGVDTYIGIDSNRGLADSYEDMGRDLTTYFPRTKIQYLIGDALTVDYSGLAYDCVFTSPPYYFLETYPHQCGTYITKQQMNDLVYTPLISLTWGSLEPGGQYCMNIPPEVYIRAFKPLLGEAHDRRDLVKFHNARTGTPSRGEYIYIWNKQ